jgi:hypothetical protein
LPGIGYTDGFVLLLKILQFHSMKYQIKHAKKSGNKEKIKLKKKNIILISIISGAVIFSVIIVTVVLNFQLIYGFINPSAIITVSDAAAEKIEETSDVEIDPEGEKAEEAEKVEEDALDVEQSEETEKKEVENKTNSRENIESENNTETETTEDEPAADEEIPKEQVKENTSNIAPSIKLEIYEGPLYSKADDICYYRVGAIVTGKPYPKISFSKDDSLGWLGSEKTQVNIKRDSGSYLLTATASNSEGTAQDTLTLVWGCDTNPPAIKSMTSMVGYIDVSVEKLVGLFEKRNPAKLERARRLAPIYIQYGRMFNIRADIAWAQMCHETGFLEYTGDVKPDQNNFAGIGATGGGVPGNSFATEELGIIAQYAHLAWYYFPDHVNKYCSLEYDPRHFENVHKYYTGDTSLGYLNGRWAPGATYTDKIVLFANEIYGK